MKPLLLVTSLLFFAFAVTAGALFLRTDAPLSLLSNAQSAAPLNCKLDATLYVRELDSNGLELPLSTNRHPDIDVFAWTIIDTQKPNAQSIFFTALPILEHSIQTNTLAFNPQPRISDVYQNRDKAIFTLNYQKDLFRVVKSEIAECSTPHNKNICGENAVGDNQENFSLESLRPIELMCNMTLKAGWVVQRISPQENAASASNIMCDLNGDNACNTFDLFIVLDTYGEKGTDLKGDINTDGTVNALDYTLMTSSISLL